MTECWNPEWLNRIGSLLVLIWSIVMGTACLWRMLGRMEREP